MKDIAKNLALITQIGLSICTPIILCILAAKWLMDKFSLGGWVIIAGALIGAGAGIMSLIKLGRSVNDKKK